MANDSQVTAENRRKHLELIQGVVARLAGMSAQVKGWAVTIVTALLAVIAAARLPSWVAFLSLLPILLFWSLDAYYLHQERLFRKLYDDAITPNSQVAMFSMKVSNYDNEHCTYATAIASSSVKLVYIALLVIAGGYGLIGCWYPASAEGACSCSKDDIKRAEKGAAEKGRATHAEDRKSGGNKSE